MKQLHQESSSGFWYNLNQIHQCFLLCNNTDLRLASWKDRLDRRYANLA